MSKSASRAEPDRAGDHKRRSRARRLLWLVPLGLLLAAISGYIGAAFLPQAYAVWFTLLFLKGITFQIGAFLAVLAGPAIYGMRWMWPVTCVVLPLASIAIRRPEASTPFMLLALGAVTGAATLYIGAASGYDSFNVDDALSFALAGAIAGAVSGAVFGLALRRAERHL